jgi:hypothetical protein
VSIACIDHCKAFDSVAHSWLIKVIEIYKMQRTVLKVLLQLMGMWNTALLANNTEYGKWRTARWHNQPKDLVFSHETVLVLFNTISASLQ